MGLPINTLFITHSGTVTLTLTGWCTDLWGEWLSICTITIQKKMSAPGTVPHSFQNHPTRLSCHVGRSWNRQFGVSYNNLPKYVLAKKWIQNYMGACFQAPCAAPRHRLMETCHVH